MRESEGDVQCCPAYGVAYPDEPVPTQRFGCHEGLQGLGVLLDRLRISWDGYVMDERMRLTVSHTALLQHRFVQGGRLSVLQHIEGPGFADSMFGRGVGESPEEGANRGLPGLFVCVTGKCCGVMGL